MEKESMLPSKDGFVATIGLEVHAELKTVTKMFCACKNDPDEEKPNSNICPVCMGHPGTLPVLNKEAIRHVLKMGYAVDATIATEFTEWDRKNYFYPDIPKGYQISQYKYPLVTGGELAGVAITRIHLEEDTAQSTHDTHEKSLVNFNRAGVPLMELVTEPVIHDAETAVRFAKELQLLLRYIGAGDANMEKGEMRVEANISIATPEDTAARKFGTKTEVKNLNSFRSVERAIAFEISRQAKLIKAGEKVVQETRGWDDAGQKTFSQRAKENSHDYRYFPDPDLPKLKISEIADFAPEVLKKDTPELPWVKRNRLKGDYEMTDKEVAIFVETPEIGLYFEDVIGAPNNLDKSTIKLAINYILTDYLGLIKKDFGEDVGKGIRKIQSGSFAMLVKMITEGKLSSRGAKDTLALMYANPEAEGGIPEVVAEKNGLIQKSDEEEIKKLASGIIDANPSVVAEYKSGKAAAFQFLIGQGMKATKGSVNPKVLHKIFTDLLL